VSFVDRIDRELACRGVGPSLRRRIRLEYEDHIAADASGAANLGDPRELAREFASELAADGARSDARETFAALIVAAVALLGGQLSIGSAGGYPGFDHGGSTIVAIAALLMVLIAPQVALIWGSLGALRALRRRRARELPDAEAQLVHRRCAAARAGGLITCAGLLLWLVNFNRELAGWWLATQAALAVAAALCLFAASARARPRRRIAAGVPGPAGGLAVDLPPLALVSAHPIAAGAVATALGMAAVTVLGAHAEHSLIEGIERGGFEGLVVGGGSALLLWLARRR
jgi:hypothetical protein